MNFADAIGVLAEGRVMRIALRQASLRHMKVYDFVGHRGEQIGVCPHIAAGKFDMMHVVPAEVMSLAISTPDDAEFYIPARWQLPPNKRRRAA